MPSFPNALNSSIKSFGKLYSHILQLFIKTLIKDYHTDKQKPSKE